MGRCALAGVQGVEFPCRVRTRLVLVSSSCRCDVALRLAGRIAMRLALAWAMAGSGVDGRHSGRGGVGDPRGLQIRIERLPRQICTRVGGQTVAAAADLAGSLAKAAAADDSSASCCPGCCCSGCGERRAARGIHLRWVAVGYSFALRERGGYATFATGLMVRWPHGETVARCCAGQ